MTPLQLDSLVLFFRTLMFPFSHVARLTMTLDQKKEFARWRWSGGTSSNSGEKGGLRSVSRLSRRLPREYTARRERQADARRVCHR